jgi:hypothetical protein
MVAEDTLHKHNAANAKPDVQITPGGINHAVDAKK